MFRLTIVLSAFCKAFCLQVEEAALYEQQEQLQLQLGQQLQQLQEQQQQLLKQQQQLLLQQRPAPARKNGLAAHLQGLQHKHAPVSMPGFGAQVPQHKHAPASLLAVGAQVGHAQRHVAQPGAVEEFDVPAGGEAALAPRPEQGRLRNSQLELVRDEPTVAAQDEPTAQPTANDASSDLAAQPVSQPDQAAAEAPQPEQALPLPESEAAAEAHQLEQAAAEDSQLEQALPPTQPEEPQPDQASAPQPEAAAREQEQEASMLYQLRLCNAYAWPLPVEMRRVEAPMLVEHPLPYKACRDYRLPLREGDQLEFSAGDVSIGTFSVRGLPQDPRSQLLLIPHRRDATSSAVAFGSHIFHPAVGPQVAVIDAFKGTQQSTLRIKEPTREEELSWESVVDVVPGSYKLTLEGSTRRIGDPAPYTTMLTTKGDDSYIVMRVGTGSDKWPEELIVFPQFSGGARATVCAAVFAILGLLSAV